MSAAARGGRRPWAEPGHLLGDFRDPVRLHGDVVRLYQAFGPGNVKGAMLILLVAVIKAFLVGRVHAPEIRLVQALLLDMSRVYHGGHDGGRAAARQRSRLASRCRRGAAHRQGPPRSVEANPYVVRPLPIAAIALREMAACATRSVCASISRSEMEPK